MGGHFLISSTATVIHSEQEDRTMKLGHVNIYVRDAAASRDWYTKILGLHTYHYA